MSDYRSLNDVAYDHLRSMIHNSDLQFDRIYSETKLASELSISRTPIRDALNRLSQERYIDILPNRGFVLHKPTQADIVEAYHVRMMIEGYCGEIIAEHYPDPAARAAIGTMEDALERQQQLLHVDSAYSLIQFWRDDLAFHRAMLDYMGISSLNVQYDRFMHIFRPQFLLRGDDVLKREPVALERHQSTLTEHQEITEALKSHDLPRVRGAIREHLNSSLRVLYASMEA